MDRLRRALSLRWLLSGWFLVVLAGALLALGCGVYVLVDRYLYFSSVQSLRADAVAGLERTDDGDDRPLTAPADLEKRAQELVDNIGSRHVLARLLTPEGRTLAESRATRWPPDVDSAELEDAVRDRFARSRKDRRGAAAYFDGDPRKRWLMIFLPLRREGRLAAVLQVGTPYFPQDTTLAMLRWYLLLAGLVAMGVGLAAGWWISASIARPLERLAETARGIAGGDWSARARLGPGRNEVYAVGHAFDDMADRVQRSFEAQRRFVADASHELRTPLTAIGGLAEVLRMGAAAGSVDKQGKALEGIEREVDKMAGLVEDLLTLSRTEEAAIPREAVDVRGLIEDVARGASRPLAVHVAGAPTALGHRGLLARVLQNLLDNAFKYTPPEGSVTMAARSEGGRVVVEVADTGVGIAAQDLPRVFDRFYRADPSRTRRTGGSGLGLSIVREIVERHEGTVSIESEPGTGTRVRVSLPAYEG